MFANTKSLFAELDDCLKVCAELELTLQKERESLIACKIEELGESTFEKDRLGKILLEKRKMVTRLVQDAFGQSEPLWEETSEEAALWKQKNEEWIKAWKRVANLCAQNQKFMQHSLRNLGTMVDHLKRLLGENITYSSYGKKVESSQEGKVIEARF